MRVVVVGATGNIGTSLLEALAADDVVSSVLGIARRPLSPDDWSAPKATFASADVGTDDLEPYFNGADAVVHLAWLFQPTHDPLTTWRANVGGSMRVFAAAANAGVGTLVYSSSVGAYTPGAETPVDESWPTDSWPTAAYGREKAYVERVLDAVEARNPSMRVVRMRPAFIFKEQAASEQRRLFAGPLLPGTLVRPGRLPVVPYPAGLRFQAVHTADVADAFRRALHADVRGAFNLAAQPVIDGARLGEAMHARAVPVPRQLVRAALAGAWHLRLAPADPALLDLALRLPVMDVTRAGTELQWRPQISAVDALRAALFGMAEGAGLETPPLAPDEPSRRIEEFSGGIGER
jgi:nucleoside-diphosphate-sugar epimerase